MSAEHEGPAGGRKGKKPAAKPPRVGSSLTDAVVAALAKVDEKKEKAEVAAEPPPVAAEAGCAATSAQVAKEPPPVMAAPPPPAVAPAPLNGGAHGFRSGPGSFADLARRWAGAPPMAVVHTPSQPAPEPARATPAPATPAPEPAPVGGAAEPAPVREAPRESAPSQPAPARGQAVVPAPGHPVRVRYFGRTDVGLVREHNEDNFLVADLTDQKRGVDAPREIVVGKSGLILAVCDGMGGAAAGEVASQMAVDTIHEVFSQGEEPADRDTFARRLVRAVEEAGHRIFSAAKMDRSRRGMGTTTTLAGLVDNVLFVGQVGDSRAYVLRGGHLEQITKDQSLVNQLIEAGQLTEEEAEAFEHSNIILQALGTTEEVTVDLTFLELRRGDRLLLCSDGLSGLVHSDMIREALATTPDLSETAAKLIQMANAGGGHDNISVILADFDGEGLKAAEDVRVLYQQYPLPPDETSHGQGGAPRDTSIKSGGPKPGADVKRDDRAQASADAGESTGGGKTWLLLVALIAVAVLLAGGWFVVRPMLMGTGDTDVEPANPPPHAERPIEPEVTTPPVPPPAQTGTIHIASDVEDGTLVVNGEDRGALTDGMTIELSPGVYTLQARSGDAEVASETVTVTAGGDVQAALRVPAVPEPQVEEPTQEEPQQGESHAQRPTRPVRPTQPQGPNQPQIQPFGGRGDHPRTGPTRPVGGSSAPPSNPF